MSELKSKVIHVISEIMSKCYSKFQPKLDVYRAKKKELIRQLVFSCIIITAETSVTNKIFRKWMQIIILRVFQQER